MDEIQKLKSDQIAHWIKTEWSSRYPDTDLITLWAAPYCVNDEVIGKVNRTLSLADYRFEGYKAVECPVVQQIDRRNRSDIMTQRTGAFVFQFAPEQGSDKVEVLVVCAQYSEDGRYMTALAALPSHVTKLWAAFTNECHRLAHAYEPENRVVVIGGRHDSFVPTVEWEDIILPQELKNEILLDVQSFFSKGVSVYKRLNLKPFRKILLAGVPGTGKTMLCNALAKWALAQKYLVIYISSAQRDPGDDYASSFGKIQHALEVAAHSKFPAIILLEELDAYLHEKEKALILNVLDGSESTINPHGTLLISTTNYPEAIDERVLKRPGRLDRIFVVPETRTELDASEMLQRYLGSMWQSEHQAIVPELVGYPGAFIREVSLYALTQVAYDDLPELSLELLEQSFQRLKAQIDARDDFLKNRNRDFGYLNGKRGSF